MYKVFKHSRIKKRIKLGFIFFSLFFILYAHSYGQGNTEIKRDTTKGIDFFVNAGMYVGNKKNANYYRGVPTLESDYAQPDINYLFMGKDLPGSFYEQIFELIRKNHHGIGANEFRLYEISYMRYSVNFAFGIGLRYRFTKHFSIGAVLTQASMTAHGIASLGIKIYETNSADILPYPLLGKERRTAFELGAIYLFREEGYVCPLLEVGAYVNSTKVISADLIVENVPFSMLNRYGGQGYDPSINQTEIDRKRGGVGYGFAAALGLRLSFNKWVGIEPVAQFRLEKVNLAGYNQITPNYNFMIRIVVGDYIFASRKQQKINQE